MSVRERWLSRASRAIAALCASIATGLALADESVVAVAANFSGAMTEIVAAFEKQTGHTVKLSFGSSGKFYAQIVNGAPFQAFFSADQAKPEALERNGEIVPGSRFTYAVGALVLWSAREDLVDPEGKVLGTGRFGKLALANPRLAPYGEAAAEVLRRLGLEQATRGRWVEGENIAQAYLFVRSGGADLGFVALSQVLDEGEIRRGSAWRVPAELHEPIRQDAVLLRSGTQSEAARALLEFVKGPVAREIILARGYTVQAPAH